MSTVGILIKVEFEDVKCPSILEMLDFLDLHDV
jgi:hypothetical protein